MPNSAYTQANLVSVGARWTCPKVLHASEVVNRSYIANINNMGKNN